MSKVIRLTVACVVGSLTLTTLADNWPEYRGPNNDGVSTERMMAAWPADGPRVLWKKPVGGGLGSFAIADGKAYYLASEGDSESCFAVDLKSGEPLWSRAIGPTAERPGGQGGSGPCSTPAVDDGKVYVYGSRLKFACLDATNGTVLWEHDVQSEFNGQADSARAIRTWGNATSPIVEGDLVIIMGGGDGQTFIAFNKTTGEVAWKKHSEELTHAAPSVATIHGVRQIVFIVQSGLVSLNPQTGDVLWKAPYRGANAIGASPVVHGDIVYCSVGYGVGGGAFRIKKEGEAFSAEALWHNRGQSLNQWSTPVIKDGHVYSIHGQRNATLQCVNLETGAVAWNGPAVGQGEVMLVDNKLIVQCADGKLLLVEPTPAAYTEIASAQPLQGQAWGWPAFSDGVFVYRTNREAAAIDLSAD